MSALSCLFPENDHSSSGSESEGGAPLMAETNESSKRGGGGGGKKGGKKGKSGGGKKGKKNKKLKVKTVLFNSFCCWRDLYNGKACRLYNVLFCPLILAVHSFRIYGWGCFMVHFYRTFLAIFCFPCRYFKCWFDFTDEEFPPNSKSLGDVEGDSAAGADRNELAGSDTVWIRGRRLQKTRDHKEMRGKYSKAELLDKTMHLFYQNVEAADVCQGALGDCWLLIHQTKTLRAHSATVGSFPLWRVWQRRDAESKTSSTRVNWIRGGKYKVRLFDASANNCKGAWQNITIDDYIPCDKSAWEGQGIAKPKFTQPNGNELWVTLLEKAFAKMCGSYADLEGGSTLWALKAMTGDHARWFAISAAKDEFTRWDLESVYEKKANGKRNKRACQLLQYRKKNGKPEIFDRDKMWAVVKRYIQRKAVLCASGADGVDGLISGHAYSIIHYFQNDEKRLVKIRNPWGTGEWTGDWSDKSDKWDRYPHIKKKIFGRQPPKDDGSFWMSWSDFCEHWQRIGVIDRTVDINNLVIQVQDDDHSCRTRWFGPSKAMICGCWNFWCKCNGLFRLYYPKKTSMKTVSTDKNCCQKHILKIDQRY